MASEVRFEQLSHVEVQSSNLGPSPGTLVMLLLDGSDLRFVYYNHKPILNVDAESKNFLILYFYTL